MEHTFGEKIFKEEKFKQVMCIRLHFRCSIDYKMEKVNKNVLDFIDWHHYCFLCIKEEELHSFEDIISYIHSSFIPQREYKQVMKNVVSLLSLIYNSCIFIKVWENCSKNSDGTVKKKVKMYQAAKSILRH